MCCTLARPKVLEGGTNCWPRSLHTQLLVSGRKLLIRIYKHIKFCLTGKREWWKINYPKLTRQPLWNGCWFTLVYLWFEVFPIVTYHREPKQKLHQQPSTHHTFGFDSQTSRPVHNFRDYSIKTMPITRRHRANLGPFAPAHEELHFFRQARSTNEQYNRMRWKQHPHRRQVVEIAINTWRTNWNLSNFGWACHYGRQTFMGTEEWKALRALSAKSWVSFLFELFILPPLFCFHSWWDLTNNLHVTTKTC